MNVLVRVVDSWSFGVVGIGVNDDVAEMGWSTLNCFRKIFIPD